MEKEKHVKVYDLQDNLITEFYTYKEAGRFIGVEASTVLLAARRGNRVLKKYRIKSEGQKFRGFKHGQTNTPEYQKLVRKYNKKRCLIKYEDPELEALAIKRSREISDEMFNRKNSRELTDKYIIGALDKHLGLKPYQVTQQMIDVKRKHIQVLRALKNDCI